MGFRVNAKTGQQYKYHNMFDHVPPYLCCDNIGLDESW